MSKKKRFTLPGNNRKKPTTPPPVAPAPGPIALTAENAPLWTAKFMEEIRNEFRILNGQLKELIVKCQN